MTESVDAVQEAVAQILDSRSPGLPLAIGEVAAYRSAARRIAEADISQEDKARLLIPFAAALRANATIREWAQGAVWEEVAGPVFDRWDEPPLRPMSELAAARALRNAGCDVCPACKRYVDLEWEIELENKRWRRALERDEVRRKAVPA